MQFNIEIIDSRHFVSSELVEENLRNSRGLSCDGLQNVRGGKIEKTPRKTDFGNTGKLLARKIFLGVLRKVGNPCGVYCRSSCRHGHTELKYIAL